MGNRPTYTKEFKERAVQLSLASNKFLSRVAKELEISEATLSNWRREAGVAGPRGHSPELRAALDQVEQLKKQVKQLEKEKKVADMHCEILKKAAALFAKDQGRPTP